jgi:hypothetical protein
MKEPDFPAQRLEARGEMQILLPEQYRSLSAEAQKSALWRRHQCLALTNYSTRWLGCSDDPQT